MEQLTLARFMESGDYERHVNRQRTRYRRRLSALIDVLAASSAGDHLHFANAGAGLHFLMEVRGVEGEQMKLLENIDILVDGPFLMEQRTLEARFRGSKNQRIINVPQSLKEHRAVLETAERWVGESK